MKFILYICSFLALYACKEQKPISQTVDESQTETTIMTIEQEVTNEVYLGGGCFWCVEAMFEVLDGVTDVESGYSGGKIKNPTYKEVCTGYTGHAEVVKIVYDSTKITYRDIIDAFWIAHDPTTLNYQHPDRGTQYRSIILYQNQAELQVIHESKKKVEDEKLYLDVIVTEIEPLGEYYTAEAYHQDYFRNNPTQPYCSNVTSVKLQKFLDNNKLPINN